MSDLTNFTIAFFFSIMIQSSWNSGHTSALVFCSLYLSWTFCFHENFYKGDHLQFSWYLPSSSPVFFFFTMLSLIKLLLFQKWGSMTYCLWNSRERLKSPVPIGTQACNYIQHTWWSLLELEEQSYILSYDNNSYYNTIINSQKPKHVLASAAKFTSCMGLTIWTCIS